MKTRLPPDLKFSHLPKGWLFLLQHFDTVQEAWDYRLHDHVAKELEELRLKAQELADDGTGLAAYKVAGEILQIHATGARGGFKWVASNDDFMLLLKAGKSSWSVSVRYLSGGLYEHGIDDLVDRVKFVLDAMGEPRQDDYRRLSRVDVAFDFYAPGFADSASPRLASQVLMPARCKLRAELSTDADAEIKRQRSRKDGGDKLAADKVRLFARAGRLETLTLGSKSSLQIELYHKSLEITEASGKDWLYMIWEEQGLPAAVRRDVWRLEVRFAGEWLKNRNVRRLSQFMEWRHALIQEALVTRRLAIRTKDSNRARWPLHPFWSHAVEDHPTPIWKPTGRYITGRRGALRTQSIKALAGHVVSTHVLSTGVADVKINDEAAAALRDEFRELTEAVIDQAVSDHRRLEKILERSFERQRFVEEAS